AVAVEVEVAGPAEAVGNPADAVGGGFGEPEIPVGAGDDPEESRAAGHGPFPDDSVAGDPSHLMAGVFDEPDVAIGARCDAERARPGESRDRVLVDRFGHGVDTPDAVAERLGEPDLAVGAGDDAARPCGS